MMPPRGRRRRPDAIAPDGSEIRYLVRAERASLVEVRLPAGQVSRPVRHRTVEEVWYVTGGEGDVWRCPPGGRARPVPVRPGDALVIPTGWSFQFRAGRRPLRFLCYTSPPWPGEREAVPVAKGELGPPTTNGR
ncbi:MAG TPA: cupin domain-containing protein [Candidatus Acidoferrales bacterium]|nr:cupin domain-containing protein [Candidatus Acidoferrales bacterium]